MRAIAVDWSGRKTGARQAIRIAEARDGELVRVEGGRDREEAIAHLIEEAGRDPELIAGFDFSFSLPGWFVETVGATDGPGLWLAAERHGEQWLDACDPPFWGRPGCRKPADDPARPQLRRTDIETAALAAPGGLMPRSPFQVSGAGSVGASTVRGLPHLLRLREAGFRIWPWDDAEPPVAIEIWTRVAIGPTVKSDPDARRQAAEAAAGIPDRLLRDVCETEDAFDAALSAIWLSENADHLAGTPRTGDSDYVAEGCTWVPGAGTGR